MRRLHVLVLLGVLAASGTACGAESSAPNVLGTSVDREELERAAGALAASPDPQDLARLEALLRDSDFLARLDDLGSPQQKTRHLRAVMARLGENPSPEVAALCLALFRDPVFTADDDRKEFLLQALAVVNPMSEATAVRFRETNAEGWFAFNAPLLAKNGSSRALALFEEMMLDPSVPLERRVDCLHSSLVPRRTQPSVLAAAGRLLADTQEPGLANGVIESLFRYEPKQWFGTSPPPPPPPWDSAPPAVRDALVALGDAALARPDLDADLARAVRAELQRIRAPAAQGSP